MQQRKTGLLVAAVAASCLAGPSVAAAATKVVYAGGPVAFQKQLKAGGANDFLVKKVTVHVGDTVIWDGKALAGGFHTVDIAKLNGEPQALFTATGHTVQGVNDAAGNPFWFNGKVPVLGLNTQLFGRSGPTSYNGTTRVESGLPIAGPKDFKVKFGTPGTYKYFCDVHPGMIGYIVVKPKSQTIPSTKADANQLRAEEQHYSAEVKNLARTKVKPNRVSLGVGTPDGAQILGMFPATLSVKAGTTVTFFLPKGSREVHTASFAPPSYLKGLADSFNSPAPDPAAVYPSDPPGTITETSTAHGNGFANTGVLDQDPKTATIPPSGRITFTHAGTFHFICLIHPFMKGTVTVR